MAKSDLDWRGRMGRIDCGQCSRAWGWCAVATRLGKGWVGIVVGAEVVGVSGWLCVGSASGVHGWVGGVVLIGEYICDLCVLTL